MKIPAALGYVIAVVVFGGAAALLMFALIDSVSSMEHYLRVKEKGISVEATVVRHEQYQSDDETRYRSYVSYRVEGTSYENIRYENKGSEKNLTPVGSQVVLKVSPEDPSVQLSELKASWTGMFFGIPVTMALLIMFWNQFLSSRRSKGNPGMPDEQTIRRDSLLTVCSRFQPYFWFLAAASWGFMRWRYGGTLPDWLLVPMLGACGLWIWAAIRGVRDLVSILRGEPVLRRDVLVSKLYRYNDEGSDLYQLTFRGENGTWKRRTTEFYYNHTAEGDTVQAVYLPTRKKPLLHYDKFGNAV